MLSFAVYDKGGPAPDWPLDSAYLLGPDDIPVAGKIAFKGGNIICKTNVYHSIGLCLAFDTGSMGRIMLQTCLLPERKKPYNMSVELARHSIKTFLAKSEEWQLFNLESTHPAIVLWEKARQLFAEALTIDDQIKLDKIAKKALNHAIKANERLALAHAELLLHWRFASRAASSTTLGVRIHTSRDSAPLRDLVKKNFDILFFPLKWNEIEVEEGRYNWEPIDRWVQWAKKEEIPFVLGPLLDFSKDAIPQWLYVWQHDYSTLRDLAYEHVERIVHRYRSVVGMWNIAAGINVNDNFIFTPEQMVDLTHMSSLIVRQSQKGARTMIELVQPFGEFVSRNKNSMSPLVYLQQIIQEGVQIDCVGVQLLFGHKAKKGFTTRNLMHMSSVLDRYMAMELPILVSAMGVPSEPVGDIGGWWHEPWSPAMQSQWVSRAFVIAMSKPYIESVIWSDLYDHEGSYLPLGGLVDANGRTKPALARLVNMRKQLKKPLGKRKKTVKNMISEATDG